MEIGVETASRLDWRQYRSREEVRSEIGPFRGNSELSEHEPCGIQAFGSLIPCLCLALPHRRVVLPSKHRSINRKPHIQSSPVQFMPARRHLHLLPIPCPNKKIRNQSLTPRNYSIRLIHNSLNPRK
ncbi:hypothetical protein VTL71DRAFT_13880 [Oculimacula yallundae]|uniref:Uncharacterized protein n=1 Tax=Oculimacula yallundae TaxID=86028 RepID=A0ABR4CLN7_9HELO